MWCLGWCQLFDVLNNDDLGEQKLRKSDPSMTTLIIYALDGGNHCFSFLFGGVGKEGMPPTIKGMPCILREMTDVVGSQPFQVMSDQD